MKKFFTTALMAAVTLAAQAQYTVNGNATEISTKKLPDSFELTPDLGNQKGAVWNNAQIDLANYNFNLTFKANFGSKDANGADGIALVFQNDNRGKTAVGAGSLGQYIGFQGIAPSLNIEFDTYNNGAAAGDIAADHISVSKNGSTDAGNQLTAAVQASASNANIEDGQDHTIQVTWNAVSTTLSIYFDGSLRQTYTNDVVQSIFSNNGLVYWGFTASTGGYTNQQRVYQLNMTVTQAAGSKDANPLPVSLLNFTAENTAKGNRVSWATASEKNSAYFEVQRSSDAKNWNTVTQIKAQGNSNRQHNYQITDGSPTGLSYYRLKMVDLDATFEYSKIVAVKANAVNAGLTAYPNPVSTTETLIVNVTGAASEAVLTLTDMLGNTIKTQNIRASNGQAAISTNGLKPGMYVLQIGAGGVKETTRIQVR